MPRKESVGTPATVALTTAGVPFTVHTYDHDPSAKSFGLEAAEVLGLPPEQVFKTLLVDTGAGLAVGIVPVSCQLDLKAVATVLENDDRIYTPADLLPLCARTGLPFVYDVHHHRCHPDGLTVEAVTEQALATWLREPLFHLSSPRDGWQGANPRPHHDYIDPGDLPACWVGRQLTVEVEAKAKELALQRLIAAQAPRAATP